MIERQEIIQKLRSDPVFFCKTILGFTPYSYQEKLLQTESKRVVAVWGRQSGKTTCIAIKVTHFVYTKSNKTVLIISKGLRQSMIMFGVITNMILSNDVLSRSVTRITRTQVWLSNGSTIVALPCSSSGANLRGYTADMVVMDEILTIKPVKTLSSFYARNSHITSNLSNARYNWWNSYHAFNSLGQKLNFKSKFNCIPHLL